MKLNLSINANQALLSYVQPVVSAASDNSTINILSAETWSCADLNALATTAASQVLH